MIRRCIIYLTKKFKVDDIGEVTDAMEEIRLDDSSSPSNDDQHIVSVFVCVSMHVYICIYI